MSQINDIAVLIPAYNPGMGLERAIDSILANDALCDIYVVDDGSTIPISGMLPKRMSHINVIRSDRNLGISGALNLGLAAILAQQYRYIARMDCGDFAASNRLSEQMSYAEHHGVDICGCWVAVVDEQSRERLEQLSFPEADSDIRNFLPLNSCITHSAMMIKANIFSRIGLYSEDYPVCEDYELLRRAEPHVRFGNVPKVLMECERAPNGLSVKRRREQLTSRLRVQVRHLDLRWRTWAGIARTLILLVAPLHKLRKPHQPKL